MYKVLTDFHHASLLNSLIMLFEKRLGGMVFRPIGMEWAERGYWAIYDHPATQAQYLSVGGATPDGTPPLNDTEGRPPMAGVYWCKDIDSYSVNKAMQFDAFMQYPIDIVIASVPQHVEPFKRLCAAHPNKPKLIYQIGNAWGIEAHSAPNVMASAKIDVYPSDVHLIQYHQEFNLDIFSPVKMGAMVKKIKSFVNCFDVDGNFADDWELFKKIERAMPEWDFKVMGGQCRDGAAHGTKELAKEMQYSRFIWHTKRGGDGYGHVLYNSAAVGKPTIVKMEYYQGKLGSELLMDGDTCVAIDGLNPEQIKNKIEYYNDPAQYNRLSDNVIENFHTKVDFDAEAEKLKVFLANLQ